MTENQANMPLTPLTKKSNNSVKKTLTHLVKRPPIDIEFTDLSYAIPQGKGNKIILRGISGLFRSGHLSAIMGPSGAGKSTLLNILAGFKCSEATGNVLINGCSRSSMHFRKMSRYIMQEDLLQPHITVYEAMTIAADLKLGNQHTKEYRIGTVDEIIDLLLLTKAKDTYTNKLSGGERKRLSIALELVNNPPVIFLDEPTTGLDDLSSSQCINMLKMLAEGGRTVICSVHTPSAKLFAMFDHVYIVAAGQCVFQGLGTDIVPFLNTIGLQCPRHYNPADFVIEVTSGEYGDYIEKMMAAIDNGHCYQWSQHGDNSKKEQLSSSLSVCSEKDMDHSNIVTSSLPEEDVKYDFNTSSYEQFKIILRRMILQMLRDKGNLLMQMLMYAFLTLIIGGLYYDMGYDGAKQLFNFGFCYTCIIVFLYIPMLPVLLQFPFQVQLLKREYFNRWYSLNAYYMALTVSRLPAQLILGTIYVCAVYWLSSQPPEIARVLQFIVICQLIGLCSESMGFSIASRLNIVNSTFVGPVISVPLMLFAIHGMGAGLENVPIYMRIFMCLSYLRFGFEGLMYAIYGNGRPMMSCPPEEIYCHFRSPKTLLSETGMDNSNIWVAVFALLLYIFVLKVLCFFLLRWRLSPNRHFAALNYVGRIIKSHFSSSQQYK